jgi:hypothetical protein
VLKADDWNLDVAKKLCRFKATVAGDNLLVLVDQDRCIEAEGLNAFGDCPDLQAAMLARILRIGSYIRNRDKCELPGVSTSVVAGIEEYVLATLQHQTFASPQTERLVAVGPCKVDASNLRQKGSSKQHGEFRYQQISACYRRLSISQPKFPVINFRFPVR